GVKVAKDCYTDHKHENPEIAALESYIFRYPYEKYDKEINSIFIKKELNPKTEIGYVMNEAEHLIRDLGYRYRDIAIITGDIAGYAADIEKEAKKRGILVFIDRKKDILKNPLVELIRAAIAVIDEEFAYEPVMRFLRSGFAAPDADSIDIFENFIIRTGLRGKKSYEKEWNKCDAKVNEVRSYVLESFEALYTVFKSEESVAADLARGIYDFLLLLDAENILADMKTEFEKEGELLLAKEYDQVYRLVLSVFEKMSELMGDEKLSIEDFSAIVESGFKEEDVGLIPAGQDCLLVGDLNRTRIKGIKALFVVGVNEGIIPASSAKSGILSDADKEKMASFDIELAPTLRERQITEQFYLYMNLTKPTERLYLTYSVSGRDGALLRPSYVISKVKKIFTGINEMAPGKDPEDILFEVRKDGGVDYVIDGLLSDINSDKYFTLLKYYLTEGRQDPAFMAAVSGFESKREDSPLSKAVRDELYKEMKGSVSRLEDFAACGFAHFMTYGLSVNERRTNEIAMPDLGSVYHDFIAKYSSEVKESPEGFMGISNDRCREIAEKVADEVISGYEDGIFSSSARLSHKAEQIKDIAVKTAIKITEQVQAGDFLPDEFEGKFEADGLTGKIDRVDKAVFEDKELIRIIDYKSSEKKFDLDEFYYGLNIQLALYLSAVLKAEKRKFEGEKAVVPSGMLYYTFKNPILDEGDEGFKEFRMKGPVNKDLDSICANDREFGELYKNGEKGKSSIIEADIGAKGKLKGSLYAENVLSCIAGKADDKANELIKSIKDGNIEINPYKLGDKEACTYCALSGICGFEGRTGRFERRKLKKLSPEQIQDEFGIEGEE
ncbi:MAG: PD-(D/E)XK nuclease family protein, partial [Lachnospiraceae bacterium]|nr:PD-(D/E)XK nuclease family protein [Lachnospiraceae bacterium]